MLVNYINRINLLVAAPVVTGFIVGPTYSFAGAILVAGVVLLIGMAPTKWFSVASSRSPDR